MSQERSGIKLKRELSDLLMQDDFGKVIENLPGLPAKKAINALVSFLCHLNELVRWRSITALGIMVSLLSEKNLEEGRILMRRFMWMLNEESGGIGWGIPETMGEIIARSPVLGIEFNRIIVSYLDENGNYLDHDPLRQGALWGIARASETKANLMKDGACLTRTYFDSDNAMNRGLACIIAGHLNDKKAVDVLNHLTMDKTEINLYKEGYFKRCTISDLAGKALNRLS